MQITSYKKKNGKTCYKLKAYLGLDPKTAKPVEITRQGFTSEKDAKLHYLEELRKFEAQTDDGALLPAITFNELADKWFPIYESTVGESTYQKTYCYFKNQILPAFGAVFIDKIDLPLMNRTVIEWAKTQSKASIIFSYAKRVLDLGIELGYLRSHPGSQVKVPKKKRVRTNKTMEFLEREDLIAYLAAADKHLDKQWSTYLRLLAMTGLRRGEALALKGSDITDDIITVDKTIATGKEHQTYIGPPKSRAGYRSVRLDNETLARVKELVKEPKDFIFRKPDGHYWSLSRPGHQMDKLSKVAKVPKITPHVLRHTHCALLFEAGAGLKEVQDRLGHEDIEITLAIYNHVSARKKHEAIDRLTSYLDGTSFGGNSVEFDTKRRKLLKNKQTSTG